MSLTATSCGHVTWISKLRTLSLLRFRNQNSEKSTTENTCSVLRRQSNTLKTTSKSHGAYNRTYRFNLSLQFWKALFVRMVLLLSLIVRQKKMTARFTTDGHQIEINICSRLVIGYRTLPIQQISLPLQDPHRC